MSKEETMVERVARAIYEKRNGAGATPWSRRSAAHKDPYLDDASAALDALMEPSKPMLFFGMDAMARDDLEPTEEEMRTAYRAMLSKAKEQGK